LSVCSYVVWLGVFSVAGWLWECTLCAVTTGRWNNRGFLFGPVCPIYGSGVVAALLVFTSLGLAAIRSSRQPTREGTLT